MANERGILVSMLAVLILLTLLSPTTASTLPRPLTHHPKSAGVTAVDHCYDDPVQKCDDCQAKIKEKHYKCVSLPTGQFQCCECLEC
ncbi:hypothetical protein SUGI_1510520 [Cryptomeria japonica]|uniref:Uncharacterized protein n=1 Tax=Cryptomeria japonica TaxID=3369 RepID=A0AAD3NN24_CRYJA|nr:hypothetical protein SUGI_0714080 [Cryptomeria japonica]GLJ58212.1 hypothetical protein SUGI_1423440 [Cryptomeria japonica]GLJ58213.1 hypothetical protein SUGI_1423480 [Cryptomeria japonica]GLJ58700.1 hypothetical protein SUGI_1469030 [Cryptomeria japonica]GLJ58722.1 hypothetical protein SUGI_1471610 [Cryptomeria japonica]